MLSNTPEYSTYRHSHVRIGRSTSSLRYKSGGDPNFPGGCHDSAHGLRLATLALSLPPKAANPLLHFSTPFATMPLALPPCEC